MNRWCKSWKCFNSVKTPRTRFSLTIGSFTTWRTKLWKNSTMSIHIAQNQQRIWVSTTIWSIFWLSYLFFADHSFLLLHLNDTFQFWNELSKTQATSVKENDIFIDYISESKALNYRYGRGAVFFMFVPFVYVCGFYKGWIWKGGLLYVLTKLMNAQYDLGMYARFFVHAPQHIRKVLELDPDESFACIQSRLFMKHCAKVELQKATGEEPKKLFTEMCCVRSYRN